MRKVIREKPARVGMVRGDDASMDSDPDQDLLGLEAPEPYPLLAGPAVGPVAERPPPDYSQVVDDFEEYANTSGGSAAHGLPSGWDEFAGQQANP